MSSQQWHSNRGGRRHYGGDSFREKQRQGRGTSFAKRQEFMPKEIQKMREETQEELLAPIVYALPKTKGILEVEPAIRLGLGHPFPRFDFGFHQWVYQTKDGMSEILKLTGNSKSYHIINRFAHRIEGKPEESVETKTVGFFGLDKKPAIMSRAFYKMWEMICLFDLVPSTGKFQSAHLAEAPGSFIQGIVLYRDKFAKSVKGDRHYGITLHSEKGSVPEMEQKFMEYYGDRVQIHKTVPADKVSKGKDNGDLTDPRTIANFAEENSGNAQLVTADGGMGWRDENLQEQESFMLVLGQIICALHAQATGGAFVIKLYDTFCTFTWKMLMLLNEVYTETNIIKPLMSRDSNSERYVVCLGFRLSDDKRKKLIKRLTEQLESWRDGKLQAQDIFTEYEIPESLFPTIRAINTQIVNRQLICINKIALYVNENDRYGSTYHKYLERQIESSRFWIGTFYRDDPSTIRKYFLETQIKLNQSRTINLGDDA
jgi:hypothetical protein